jgi:hypothetical protein
MAIPVTNIPVLTGEVAERFIEPSITPSICVVQNTKDRVLPPIIVKFIAEKFCIDTE